MHSMHKTRRRRRKSKNREEQEEWRRGLEGEDRGRRHKQKKKETQELVRAGKKAATGLSAQRKLLVAGCSTAKHQQTSRVTKQNTHTAELNKQVRHPGNRQLGETQGSRAVTRRSCRILKG